MAGTAVRIISLNCHGFNLGIEAYLSKLSNRYDIILLQETWLSDMTCYKLQNISNEFMVYHSSAMEDKLHSDILHGRPFGGTAILVRKSMDIYCNPMPTNNPRITCVSLTGINSTDIILPSVYMPCSDRSPEQMIEYEATVGHMQSILAVVSYLVVILMLPKILSLSVVRHLIIFAPQTISHG